MGIHPHLLASKISVGRGSLPNKNCRSCFSRNAEKYDKEGDIANLMKLDAEERLQKVIARAGIASRRAAERLIMDGRVSVNGKFISHVGTKVNVQKDVISVDGKKISVPDTKSTHWVVLHKPKALLTTMQDDLDRDTVLNLVPRANELRLVPVGGMDRDNTGLLLLTNEVGWIHPLTHPSFTHGTNRYEVVVKGMPTADALELLQRGGLQLEGDRVPCGPCSIGIIDVDTSSNLCLLDIKLDECKPDQLQRMAAEGLKCELVSAKRIEFGGIKLRGLKRGQWRELTKKEVESLQLTCKKRVDTTAAASSTAGSRSSRSSSSSSSYHRSRGAAGARPRSAGAGTGTGRRGHTHRYR